MSVGKDFVWTDERHAQLHDMIVVEGLTSGACAWKFGVSRNAIIGKARRLGVDFPGYKKRGARKVVVLPQVPTQAPTGENVQVVKAKPAGFGARQAQQKPVQAKPAPRAAGTSGNKAGYYNAHRAAEQRINAKLVAGESNKFPLDERFAEGFLGQKGRVALVDLEPHHCRWPIEMSNGETRYCGCAKLDGQSYCDSHFARAAAKNVPVGAVPKRVKSGGPHFDFATY